MITVPDSLATATVDREGEPGQAWVSELPDLVERYLRHWRCRTVGPPMHGGVGLIIPVESPHGDAVLKISFRHPGNVGEPDALRLWAGAGAVTLYESAPEDFALLLERVSDRSLDLALEDGLITAGRLSAQLAVPATEGMQRLADQAAGWEAELRQQDRQLDHPLPSRVVDAALQTIADLADDRTDTMAHGDLHGANILHSARGWLAIDPKGVAGPAEFDAATMIGYRHQELVGVNDLGAEVRRRLDIFCEAAGLDRRLARRLTQARAVSMALWDRLHPGHQVEFIDYGATVATELL